MNDKHRAGIWSSWIIEDGWARRPGQPRPKIPPYEPSAIPRSTQATITRMGRAQASGGTMARARLEIARRIDARKVRR